MPQWRKLHTKIVQSLDYNEMSNDFVRLTWALLPLCCCREGRGMYNGSWLRSNLYPLRDDVKAQMMIEALDEFTALEMVILYQHGRGKYFQIILWHEHQGSTTKEAPSPYPCLEDGQLLSNQIVSPELVQSKSRVSQTDVDKHLSISDSISDSSSKKGSVRGNSTAADFAEILQIWKSEFPNKPQPRADNKTLQGKLKTRMKSEHFQTNWQNALVTASQSQFLQTGDFFDLGWFLKNDNHYEQCLNGKYKDRQTSGQPPRRVNKPVTGGI